MHLSFWIRPLKGWPLMKGLHLSLSTRSLFKPSPLYQLLFMYVLYPIQPFYNWIFSPMILNFTLILFSQNSLFILWWPNHFIEFFYFQLFHYTRLHLHKFPCHIFHAHSISDPYILKRYMKYRACRDAQWTVQEVVWACWLWGECLPHQQECSNSSPWRPLLVQPQMCQASSVARAWVRWASSKPQWCKLPQSF